MNLVHINRVKVSRFTGAHCSHPLPVFITANVTDEAHELYGFWEYKKEIITTGTQSFS